MVCNHVVVCRLNSGSNYHALRFLPRVENVSALILDSFVALGEEGGPCTEAVASASMRGTTPHERLKRGVGAGLQNRLVGRAGWRRYDLIFLGRICYVPFAQVGAEVAPQLTATKGPSDRRLRRCSAEAMISFPVPDSPVTRTGRSVPATRPTTIIDKVSSRCSVFCLQSF